MTLDLNVTAATLETVDAAAARRSSRRAMREWLIDACDSMVAHQPQDIPRQKRVDILAGAAALRDLLQEYLDARDAADVRKEHCDG